MTTSSRPDPPESPSPASVRTRRAQQRAFVQSEQTAGRLPQPQPQPQPQPLLRRDDPIVARRETQRPAATKRFEAQDVTRLPVTVTPAARAVIDASSSQGRLFPQALAEILSEHRDDFGGLAGVEIDVVPKSAHFVVGDDERDPLTGAEPMLMRLVLRHASGHEPYHHLILINASTLGDLHPHTRQPLFTAEKAAREFLRLYQQHLRVQPVPAPVPVPARSRSRSRATRRDDTSK